MNRESALKICIVGTVLVVGGFWPSEAGQTSYLGDPAAVHRAKVILAVVAHLLVVGLRYLAVLLMSRPSR